MGQCMELKNDTTLNHPLLGPLQQTINNGQQLLILTLPILAEEEYIALSKEIHKLKYNLELKDHLYLPISERFITNNVFCEAVSKMEVTLQIYERSLSQMMDDNVRMGRRLSELEIWYLILVSAKYLRYCSKKNLVNKIQPSHFVVSADGSLKIIPQQLVPTIERGSKRSLNVSRSLRKKGSQESVGHSDLAVYQVGLICLSAALATNYQDMVSETRMDKQLRNQKVQNLLNTCSNYYSESLTILLTGLLNNHSQQVKLLQVAYNKALHYQSDIKAKLESGIAFGQFEHEPLKQTHRMFEMGTPKYSRVGPQSEQQRHSFDLREQQDAVVQKADAVESNAREHSLNIL